MQGTTKKKIAKRQWKEWGEGYLFITPLLLGIFVFYIFPFIQNFWFSFNEVNKFNVATFYGLNNYLEMFKDKELWNSLGNTLLYVGITVPLGLMLSLIHI